MQYPQDGLTGSIWWNFGTTPPGTLLCCSQHFRPSMDHGIRMMGHRERLARALIVTPLVLHHKLFTKTLHEHHVYVLMHVIKSVDQSP